MKYSKQLNKRIDISEDPLFNSPNRNKVKVIRTARSRQTSQHKSIKQSQFSLVESDSPVSRLNKEPLLPRVQLLDYIREQNKEVNQIRNRQKFINPSRIIKEEVRQSHHDRSSIPQIESHFFKRTQNNFIKKLQLRQQQIDGHILKLENNRIDIGLKSSQCIEPNCIMELSNHNNYSDNIELFFNGKVDQNITCQQISLSPGSSPMRSTQLEQESKHQEIKLSLKSVRTRLMSEQLRNQQFPSNDNDLFNLQAFSIERTMQGCHTTRNNKTLKVQDIIDVSEERRQKALKIKGQVYGSKPNGLQFTRLQLQSLRKQWVVNLRQRINQELSQQARFTELLNLLRDSDIQISPIMKFKLKMLRSKLVSGDEINTGDVQELVDNPDTHELGMLISEYLCI